MVNRNINQKFPKTLTSADFVGIATANQTVINGKYTDIGVLNVAAGQEIAFGQNIAAGGTNVHGASMYAKLVNETGVQIHGKIRLKYENPQSTKVIVVNEEHTTRLDDGSDGDLAKSVLLPEYKLRVPEDGRLIISFNPDGTVGTSQIVDYDGTELRLAIPATYYQ